jgi:zinc protease
MMKRLGVKLPALFPLAMVFALSAHGEPPAASPQRARKGPQSEAWRRQPPRPATTRPFRLPVSREARLDNGLTLILIEDRRTPMVTLDVGIPVGGANDPADQPGLAEATAELITEGAGSLTSEQLAREVESLGGRLFSSAGDDYTEVGGAVVSENAERMVEIIGDVLMRPTFPAGEVALYKNNRVQNLAVQRQDPAFLLSEHFNRIIYGAHPYGVSAPTPESVASMDRAKVEGFYKAHYTPAGSVMVMVGDFDAARMEARARAVFGGWRAPAAGETKFPAIDERKALRVYLIDRPGSEQSDFRIGNLATARSGAGYFPLLVANTILGGGTSSRLFLNIREQKGYSYDVYSAVHAPLQRGTFFGGAQTRTETTLAAIKEMLAEFGRMRRLRVTAADLQNAKNYLNGVFSLVLSTQGGVADQIVQSRMLGLGKDYLSSYRARIESVTAADVQEAARTFILTDRPAIVVVGDAARLKKGLLTLGPVEVFDIDGKPKLDATLRKSA